MILAHEFTSNRLLSGIILIYVLMISILTAIANPSAPLDATSMQYHMPPSRFFTRIYWNGTMGARTRLNPDGDRYALPTTIGFGFPKHTGDKAVCSVAFGDKFTSGWHGLYIRVDTEFYRTQRTKAYYVAGFAEGFSTALQIYYTILNIDLVGVKNGVSQQTKQFVQDVINEMDAIADNKEDGPSFLEVEVRNRWNQLRGMYQGYIFSQYVSFPDAPGAKISFEDLFYINYLQEIYSVEAAMLVNSSKPVPSDLFRKTQRYNNGVFKLASYYNGSNIVYDAIGAHITWGSLEAMLRVYKTIEFGSNLETEITIKKQYTDAKKPYWGSNNNKEGDGSYNISYSSYFGALGSLDSFYVINNDILVMETSNNLIDTQRLQNISKHLPSGFLLGLALLPYLADGDINSWEHDLCKYNSGTLMSQWLVLANITNVFSRGVLDPGSARVVETMPGLCVGHDVTSVINKEKIWIAYNLPYSNELYKYSGAEEEVSKKGLFYSKNNNYRKEMLISQLRSVVGPQSMKNAVRHNDYINDNYSVIPNCTAASPCSPTHSPFLAVACRGDLVNEDAKTGLMGDLIAMQNLAAIDAKIYSAAGPFSTLIINGPSFAGNSSLPPFNYMTTPVRRSTSIGLQHNGVPNEMTFDYITPNAAFDGASEAVPETTVYSKSDNVVYLYAILPVTYSYNGFIDGIVSAITAMTSDTKSPFQLDSSDVVDVSMISVQRACWVGSSVGVTFYFTGANKVLLTNLALRMPSRYLNIIATNQSISIDNTFVTSGETRHGYGIGWIPGLVIACVSTVAILVVFVVRMRQKRMRGEEMYGEFY